MRTEPMFREVYLEKGGKEKYTINWNQIAWFDYENHRVYFSGGAYLQLNEWAMEGMKLTATHFPIA